MPAESFIADVLLDPKYFSDSGTQLQGESEGLKSAP